MRGFASRISRRFVILLALFQLLLLYAWTIEPNWIEVTRHEAWFKNLPEEFNGLSFETQRLLPDAKFKK